ncbi:hypothetical protein D3C81_1053680 [compost metagenome]
MGDENERDPGFFLHALEFNLHFLAQLEVQRRQRFIEQQHRRLWRQRAGQGDALLLAAGQLGRLAPRQVFHLHQRQHLADPRGNRLALHALHLQAEGDVLRHAHVREQRVALEHGIDAPAVRRQVVDPLAADEDVAAGDVLETGDGPQQRGLAAAGRSKEGEELVVRDVHRHVIECGGHFGVVGVALDDIAHFD